MKLQVAYTDDGVTKYALIPDDDVATYRAELKAEYAQSVEGAMARVMAKHPAWASNKLFMTEN